MSTPLPPEEKFTRTARAVSSGVIDSYSTSFGWATRLLGPRHRHHVRSIYALVRVADEIVDGAASGFGVDTAGQQRMITAYEEETHRAVETGYSSDLVIHSFARTARLSGIGPELITPFFASMRADLEGSPESPSQLQRYVYGSAEVVGLMCLQVFLRHEDLSAAQREELVRGARQLGAAFQHINFLRDLAIDQQELGRTYLSSGDRLTREEHAQWVAAITAELDDAARVIPNLPADCRIAVASTHLLFSELLRRLARSTVDDLYRRRVRVPNVLKVRLIAQAALCPVDSPARRR